MIQRNGRLESGESDGTDHLAETAELAAGKMLYMALRRIRIYGSKGV
jgi:hypothetical protein